MKSFQTLTAMKTSHLLVLYSALFIFGSCASQSDPIQYGHDQCAFCKMTIMDKNYGAELLNKNGKAFKFDSPECLISYVDMLGLSESEVGTELVTSYGGGASLIPAGTAVYLKSAALHSPMGADITAFSTRAAAGKYIHSSADVIIDWKAVKTEVLK